MEEVSTIGLDLAKHVFQAHGASASGAVLFRKRLRREQVLTFLAGQPRCVVAMEACASAHHWGRAIGELGHEVRLIPPAYVKPFVKRQKNDMADAEAICEAAQRPTMRFVAVKSEAKQAAAVIFRAVVAWTFSDSWRLEIGRFRLSDGNQAAISFSLATGMASRKVRIGVLPKHHRP